MATKRSDTSGKQFLAPVWFIRIRNDVTNEGHSVAEEGESVRRRRRQKEMWVKEEREERC